MKLGFMLIHNQLLPRFQRLQYQKKCILIFKDIAMACFGAAELVLMSLYRLIPSVFQVLKGKSNGSNKVLGFAFFCKMICFIAIKVFYRGRISLLS